MGFNEDFAGTAGVSVRVVFSYLFSFVEISTGGVTGWSRRTQVWIYYE